VGIPDEPGTLCCARKARTRNTGTPEGRRDDVAASASVTVRVGLEYLQLVKGNTKHRRLFILRYLAPLSRD